MHACIHTHTHTQLRSVMIVKGREHSNEDEDPEHLAHDDEALLHTYIQFHDVDSAYENGSDSDSGKQNTPQHMDNKLLEKLDRNPGLRKSMDALLQEHKAVKKWLRGVKERYPDARGAVDALLLKPGVLRWSRIHRLTVSVLVAEGMCVCVSLSVCLSLYVCVCVCVYIYIYIYTYIHTYIHTHTHINTYIHAYDTYIHTHIHTYRCTRVRGIRRRFSSQSGTRALEHT